MAACIAHITTAVPRHYYPQAFARDFMKAHVPGDRMTSMVLHRIYTQSAIDGRYSVLPDFLGNFPSEVAGAGGSGAATAAGEAGREPVPATANTSETTSVRPGERTGAATAAGEAGRELVPAADPSAETTPSDMLFWRDGNLISPTTGARNDRYTSEARALYTEAARKLFAERPDLDAQSVTHVITVSCTGFYAPGPDLDVVKALGLPASTQRFHIGFMGCYAAFPALRLARALVGADPAARVLIVSVELCTLHLKFDNDTDAMLSASVFADGAAAALVCDEGRVAPGGGHDAIAPQTHQEQASTGETRPNSDLSAANHPSPGAGGNTSASAPGRVLVIDDLRSTVTASGAGDMAWTIGDHGFDMVLSTYVPEIIAQNLDNVLAPIWQQYGLGPAEVDLWAVHPGGRAIVDKVQGGLGLADHQVAASRAVLQRYGNMSSATILFVLRELLTGSGALTADSTADSAAEGVSSAILASAVKRTETTATSAADDGASAVRAPSATDGTRVLGMAFGPGLTVETGLFRLVDRNA
jgi:alkylresorcinol/alkylpyrone synthase